jgi:hypothetical protein
MPKVFVSLPNAGPVDVDVPGWGLFRNGETYDLDEEFFNHWLDSHTARVGKDLVVDPLPYGLSIVDDDEEV